MDNATLRNVIRTYNDNINSFDALLTNFDSASKSWDYIQEAKLKNLENLIWFYNKNLKSLDIPQDSSDQYTKLYNRYALILAANKDEVEILNTSNYGKII